MKKARPYQKEIIKKAVKELSRSDRVTVLMPCASGKTLVGLWIIERMKAKNVVVFAPTLGLLAQAAREFLANTRYRNVGCLAICSDTCVVKGLDEIRPAPEESPFAVTDKVDVVRKYLEKDELPVKFLFCTYHSSDILGLALLRSGITLDLAFFDEAHRTAGKLGAPFTLTLSNENLPVYKRLFMTATLRVYNFAGASHTEVHSMDNPSNYGRVCAKMTFAEAVSLGIICSYKVIASIVDSSSLHLNLLYDGEVPGKDISARDVAIRQNILQALEKYDAKKIITYHSTIEQAENFSSKVLKDAMSGYEILHISSEMTSMQRHDVMERFRKAERAIITNARCLTEGIDVPAVDMVVFAKPKYSEIDIVQAIGRAMRVSEGKTTGYVLLPLFLDQKSGESVVEALNRNNYETVWNVLNALNSVDKDFESRIAPNKQGLEFDDYAPGGRGLINVLAPPGVDALKIQESVSIFIVKLLTLTDLWEERYGELLRFKREYGHINVPYTTRLGKWLASQRRNWSSLTKEKQERLLKLGIDLEPRETRWAEKIEELQTLKKQYGHINVLSQQLRAFLKAQRKCWDALPLEKRELLLELGFDPDPIGTFRQKRKKDLRAHAEKHGHCNVTKSENKTLASYLKDSRRAYREGRLSPDIIAELEELGIIWGGRHVRQFEDTCRKMVAYRNEHGRLPTFNKRCSREEKTLITRMLNLRKAHRAGDLSDKQVRRLKELDFPFEPDEDRFRKRYSEYEEYVSAGGDPNVIPSKHPLRGWVRFVKVSYMNGHLSQEKIELLEALGIIWDYVGYLNEKWENNFQSVAEYFEKNGVNSLPAAHPLYGWWKAQLQFFHKLPKEKADKIRSLRPIKRKDRWAKGEKTIVLENPDKTVEELAELLIGRTPQAIQELRDKYR